MQGMGSQVREYLQKLTTQQYSETEIKTYRCEGCGETVTEKKMPILGGERKGEMQSVITKCRCEDNRLAREILEEERRRKQERFQNFFNQQSVIPESLQDATLEGYEPVNESTARAKKIAEKYVEGFGKDNENTPDNLLLYGPCGTGKSHIARGILQELTDRGNKCVFIDIEQFLTMVKATFNRNADTTEEELFGKLYEADVLVLDDLGVEVRDDHNNKVDWATRQIFQVANSRQGKKTIFTTNYDPEDGLLDVVGQRNFSRLMSQGVPVLVNGPDQRIQRNRFL